MAVPLSEAEEIVNDDLQKLALAQSYFQMSESAAWKDLMERVQGLIDQAKQDHFSSREVEGIKIVEEKLRWQQREFIAAAINQIVDSQLASRAAILEEMKRQGELDEFDSNNAQS